MLIVKESESYNIGSAWYYKNFLFELFFYLQMIVWALNFLLLLKFPIQGKEKRQITFKVIALQGMVLSQSSPTQLSGTLLTHQGLIIKSVYFENMMTASTHELPSLLFGINSVIKKFWTNWIYLYHNSP